MNPVLKVFVVEDCSICHEALTIATKIARAYPAVTVEIIDIEDAHAIIPEAVFAAPTYMLNDQIVSLGNPYPEEMARWVQEALVYFS